VFRDSVSIRVYSTEIFNGPSLAKYLISLDARKQFGRVLLLNLTQYGHSMKWVKSDNDTACITIPNLEFVIKDVNELGRLHKIIKDYVNADSEHNGLVAKALRFSLHEKINSYYLYVNKWVSHIYVFEWPTCIRFFRNNSQ